MHKLSVICLVVCACALASARPDQYTDRYDGIDLDEIVANRRLLAPYVKCVLDQGKCSPEGKELKAHIREALENNCAECTEKQRSGTRKIIKHLINKEQEYWKELTEKYDPQHKYVAKYEKDLKELN